MIAQQGRIAAWIRLASSGAASAAMIATALASTVGCMGGGGGARWPTLGGWGGWGGTTQVADSSLTPPSISNSPNYPQTVQPPITPPGAYAATGAPPAEATPTSAAPTPEATAGAAQGFYNPEYPAASHPGGAPNFGAPQGGGYDPNSYAAGQQASYAQEGAPGQWPPQGQVAEGNWQMGQPTGDPSGYAQPAQPEYGQPQQGYGPPAAQPGADYANNAGAPPGAAGYYTGPYSQPAPSSGGYVEDQGNPGVYGAPAHQVANQPPPTGAAGQSYLPDQWPAANPQAGMSGTPQHRADPHYRPGSVRDYISAESGGVPSTASQPSGVRPATYNAAPAYGWQ